MSTTFDFSNLTPAQRHLLADGGWHVADAGRRVQPAKATVRKLIERGLVVEERKGDGLFFVREYSVPQPVREAFSEWVAKRGRGGALA